MTFEPTPGLHDEVPEAEYHAHRGSLSVSGAKVLLKAPALYRYQLDNPPERKQVFDFGSAAHQLILGAGPGLAVIPATGRGKDLQDAHREAKEAAYAEGKIPVTEDEFRTVREMADALSGNTLAMALLGEGKPEVSGYFEDAETGILRRCRFDWLPTPVKGRRTIIADYKTARSADPAEFGKPAADFGYAQQAAWYTDAAIALGVDPDPAFLFIVQEKTAPYLSTVIQLDEDALQIGRHLNRKALRIYAECIETDTWPGYSTEVEQVSLPGWFINKNEDALNDVA